MLFSNILSLAAFTALANAAPTPVYCRDPGCVLPPNGVVIFRGAAGAEYSLTVPLDGTQTYTNNALSISTIFSSSINIAKQCTLKTVDYTPALVEGPAQTWAVGPPQTVTWISCHYPDNNNNPTTISIEFQGADPDKGAKYTVNVPLDGSVVPTGNVLSISTLVSGYAKLADNCKFDYIDGHAALAPIGANKWAVGPPQTIRSVSCHA